MSVADLYRTVVLEHGKRPRNRGAVAGATHAAEGDNPLCGDAVRVEMVCADDALAALGFDGDGCVLVLASASLMTERLCGRSVAEARALATTMERFCADGRADAEALGELAAFGDVHRHPVRVACALLPWRTLVRALGD
jgi:nitrogen fixation NifU-like protein